LVKFAIFTFKAITVNKNLLIEVLRDHSAKSDQEATEILALKKEFPFSQVLHAISAKLSKDFAFDRQQNELQEAAVYATDRTVLKQIMTFQKERHENVVEQEQVTVQETLPYPPKVAEPTSEKTPTSTAIEKTIEKEERSQISKSSSKDNLVVYDQIEKTIDGVDVAEAVMKDLKKLNQLKNNFEMLFVDQNFTSHAANSEADSSNPLEIAESEEQPSAHTLDPETEKEINAIRESAKSKRAKIIEIARAMNHAAEAHPHTTSKRKGHHDDFIEEIKTSKEEIVPGNERLKEQIEIIDQFIKTQPSISSVKERNPVAPPDLNSIKSGEFGENIVSETLVEILVKQGKKDRAIEVLKKLIWKYPQKKAYFASQIEDLKK